jgi:hypothetical protein
MFDTWFRGPHGRKPEPKAPARRKFRPQVEVLEDRTVPAAIRDLTGFRANIILPNLFPPFAILVPTQGSTNVLQGGFTEDGFTGPVPLTFNINFFGIHTGAAFLNMNGNITFGVDPRPGATPGLVNFPSAGYPMIAPFFADADSLAFLGFQPNEPVTYGYDMIGNHRAFGVDWINVSYAGFQGFDAFKVNSFQMILIDRSDTGPGNFDIEFNYNTVQWETGSFDNASYLVIPPGNGVGARSAVAGFTDGTGVQGHYLLLAGSGAPGFFLDGGPDGLNSHMVAASTPGRYHYFFRGGMPVNPLPPVGVDLSRVVQRLNPLRFVRTASGNFLGRFFLQRIGGVFPAFADDPVLDEVGVTPVISTGPITLVFTRLPPGVTLANPTGFTASGAPYVTLLGNSLSGKGDRFRTVLEFLNPEHRSLRSFFRSFKYTVLAGPFDPTTL